MKIVVLGGYPTNPGDLDWSILEKYGSVCIYDNDLPINEKSKVISNADIVCVGDAILSKRDIQCARNLKLICILGTGYDAVDYDYAGLLGIYVCNVPNYGTMSVAQYAISLLLEICGNVGFFSDGVRNGKWLEYKNKSYYERPIIELYGKTIGIIGFGRIGQAVGRIARELGMNIVAFSRHQTEAGGKIGKYITLDELLSTSDIISIHCPLTAETRNLINESTISKMRDGVIIINNGRGQVINENDLANALNSGKVYAAGLDVTPTEPLLDSSPLLIAKNCFITPHISWQSKESRTRILDGICENIESYFSGTPINVVNNVSLTKQ